MVSALDAAPSVRLLKLMDSSGSGQWPGSGARGRRAAGRGRTRSVANDPRRSVRGGTRVGQRPAPAPARTRPAPRGPLRRSWTVPRPAVAGCRMTDRYERRINAEVAALEADITAYLPDLDEAWSVRDWAAVARIYRAVAGGRGPPGAVDPDARSVLLAKAEAVFEAQAALAGTSLGAAERCWPTRTRTDEAWTRRRRPIDGLTRPLVMGAGLRRGAASPPSAPGTGRAAACWPHGAPPASRGAPATSPSAGCRTRTGSARRSRW